ncbi:hypothetical protein DSUL_50143 [Desulfovibrionales bacterium]
MTCKCMGVPWFAMIDFMGMIIIN